ncbi:MAG TPA: hypothetical protein VGH40_20095 [Roseiarcus sp.]|jgi:localization factor PodJL
MSSATAWNVRGVGRETRAFAEEAARRAGMSLGDWLDQVVADKAAEEGVEPNDLDRDDRLDAIGERIARLARRDGRPAEEARTRDETPRKPEAREPDREETRRAEELLEAAVARFEGRAQRAEARAARAFESVAQWIERSDSDRGEERATLKAVADKLAVIDQRTARQQSLLAEAPRRLESRIDEAERELDARMSALARRLDPERRTEPPRPAERPQERVAERPAERPRIDLRDAALKIARRRSILDARGRIPEASAPKPGWRNGGADAASAEPRLTPAAPQQAAPAAPSQAAAVEALRQEILALAQRIDQLRSDQSARGAQPAADVQALRAEVAAMSRSLADLAPRNAVVALEGAMRDLSERIVAVRDNGVREVLIAPLEALLGEVRDALRAHDPQAPVAGLQREIRAIETRIDAIAKGAINPEVLERIRAQTEEVRNLLAAAAMRPVPVERLERQIGDLADRVDRLASNPSPHAETARAVALLADAREQIERSTPAAALSAIERRLEQLALRMDQALQQPQGPDAAPRAFEDLARRIDGVRASIERQSGAQPDTAKFEAALRELSAKLDRPAAAQAAPNGLAEMIQDLSARIDQRANPALDIASLEQALRSIGERPIEIDTAPIESLMRDLGAKLVAPASIDTRPFEAMLREISQKLDRAPTAAGGTGEIAAMVRDLGARIDQRIGAAIDLRPLEDALHALHERLDRYIPAKLAPALVEQAAELLAERLERRDQSRIDADALAGQISDIHDRLDALHAETSSNAALERKVGDLVAELDATRRALQSLPAASSRDDDPIADGLADIRAEQASADKRMQTRLSSLQDILERLVSRLGRIEDEVARVDEAARGTATAPAMPKVAPPTRSEALASGGAALREIPDRLGTGPSAAPVRQPLPQAGAIDGADFLLEPGSPFGRQRPPEADAAPKSAVNAHIAAARRAAQAAMAESAGKKAKPSVEPAEAGEGAPHDLARQAKSLLAGRRRPLLLAATLLAMIATVAIIEMRAGSHPPVMQKSEIEAPAKLVESARTPNSTGGAGIDTSPVGSIPGSAAGAKVAAKPAPAELVGAMPAGLSATLRDAATAGDVNAEFEMGVRLIEGRGVAKDPHAAAQWFEQAAARDLPIAQYRLGALYEKGVGVARDSELAMSWYAKAANAGNARAMHNLAVMNAEGPSGGKPDYAEAAQWFRKAAQLGVRDSQFNLGILYARGMGVPQDLAQSWVWFSLAAQQGDVDAAKKRDEVAAKMDAQALVAAAKTLAAFHVATPSPAANEAAAPAGGWDGRSAAPQATQSPAPPRSGTVL